MANTSVQAKGKIVQCIGAVVDVEFARNEMPKIYDALKMDGSSLTLEVQQQLGDGIVRTIALGSSDGMRRGNVVYKHRPVHLGRGRAQRGVGNGVKAGQQAAPLVQRGQCIHAAGELDLEVQLVALAQPAAQARQRFVVAGVQRDDASAVVKGDREGAFEFAAQRFDLRRQPRLRLAFGPQQLGAERRQPRGLALDPDHQCLAQLGFPPLQLAPHVPVGQAQLLGSAGNRACLVHRRQHGDQRVVQVLASVGGTRQQVSQVHPMHVRTYGLEFDGP